MSDQLNAPGLLYRGFAGNRTVRFLAIQAHDLANEVRTRHELGPLAAQIAAEGMVAGICLSAHTHGDERIHLQIQGERPRLAFTSDIDADGGLRARLTPSHLRQTNGSLIEGLMLVTRSDTREEHYRGVTPLEQQTVPDALSNHLNQSSQVDVIIRVGAKVDDKGVVTFAGGILVERLPEHAEHPSIGSEEFFEMFGVLKDQSPEELLTSFAFGKLADQPIELLECRLLSWRCSCSQERVEGVLAGLGPVELRSMLEDDGQAEITCHFCNDTYTVGPQRLEELITGLEGPIAES